jgi:ubiquinone/menaquinone biosynthesis C-methylase UbiE
MGGFPSGNSGSAKLGLSLHFANIDFMKSQPIMRRLTAEIKRVSFHLLYNSTAWIYDLVANLVSGGQWKAWVMAVLPHLNGKSILEIGHGPGHLQSALHEKGLSCYGIDTSRQMGQQAYKRLVGQGFRQQLTRAYAQHFPFPRLTFDQIVATFPTEYIFDSLTLNEAYRTLKPGGSLLVLLAAHRTSKPLTKLDSTAIFKVEDHSPALSTSQYFPFYRAGFQTEVQVINQPSWSLIFLIARKPQDC